MKQTMKTLFFAVALTAGVQAWAQVDVAEPWVRGTVAGQKATGAFLKISAPEGAKLIGVSSPIAGISEIHEMKMDGDVMKMRAIPALEVPKGQTVELKPGGYHIMLLDLKKEVKKGDVVPLTLKFETADKKVVDREINADVRPLGVVSK